ncbi:MAG: ATP-dependent RNA helicase RhlE [Myxococcota bacterium]|jgi:ATP-dependent RNA helicase RhlE
MQSFVDADLLPSLVETLTAQGLTRPTEIQAKTLPLLLAGKPLVGVSETGSGKTLAFVLPMLHWLKTLELEGSSVSEPGTPRGLVLVPGRELGEQVGKVFRGLTHDTRLRVRMALGGSPKRVARKNVAGKFEVLVATPGRLLQLVDSGELKLGDVRIVVFDEADQMLDPGFLPVALRIADTCPSTVQLVMFSATFPESLQAVVTALYPVPPEEVRTAGSHHVVPTLMVENWTVIRGRRFDVLRPLLMEHRSTGTLLFTNTREQCEGIADWLHGQGIPYVVYRGQMERLERRKNLAMFRSGAVSVLIATDLGGRGLDIERVERVINVYLPREVNNYLHRVGRTARAGRSGTVINLVTERDAPLMAELQRREASRE